MRGPAPSGFRDLPGDGWGRRERRWPRWALLLVFAGAFALGLTAQWWDPFTRAAGHS